MLSLNKPPKEYSETELKYLMIDALKVASSMIHKAKEDVNSLREKVTQQSETIALQSEIINGMKKTLDSVIRSSALDAHILPVAQTFAYGKFPIVVMSSGESLSRFAHTILPNGDCVAWLKGKKSNPPDDGDTRVWKKGTWYKAEP